MTMDRATVERTAHHLVAQVQRIASGMEERDRQANERFQEFYRTVQEERVATEAALDAARKCLAVAADVLAEIHAAHATFTIEVAAFNEQATAVATLIRTFADAVRTLQPPPGQPVDPAAAP